MIIGVPPPLALIVVNTAGIETEIAANGPHIAMSGACDVRCRLREHGIVFVDAGMRGYVAQYHRRTELYRLVVDFYRVQFLHTVHVNEYRRRNDAATDIDHQISAAPERHRPRIACAGGDGFFNGPWTEHLEFGERVHQLVPRFFDDFSDM